MRMHPTDRGADSGHSAPCARAAPYLGVASWLVAAVCSCSAACNAVLGIDAAELDSGGAAGPALGAPAPPVAAGVGSSNPSAGAAGQLAGVDPSTASAPPASPAPMEASPSPSGVPTRGEAAPAAAAPGAAPAPVASLPPVDAGAAGSELPPGSGVLPVGPLLGADGLAVPLPDDLLNAPVSGEIIYSQEASWEVDGVFQPTFEIHTPTGSYWIVKSLGTMVSMQDAAGSQWIDFSSGFRPLRNVPAFAAPPSGVSTVLDPDSQTPTHLRLTTVSGDQSWQWVWDFYITHATLTINRAPVPVGFSYRGVPAGSLGAEDQLTQSDGSAQGARNSFNGELPGPVEWVYIADTSAGRSLFLVQHTDDTLPERYQVRDNDSAMWLFGDGQITSLPVRFSLGLVDGVDLARVSERVQFVAGAIH